MNIVIFGLAVSSSWGNGHATIWRGLIHELLGMGHEVTFFEKDVPYYSIHRDFTGFSEMELILYENPEQIYSVVNQYLKKADVAIVTSYCPHAIEFSNIVFDSNVMSVFYDLDTPVTLDNIKKGECPAYIPGNLAKFDVVLSFTGGCALELLKRELGARRVYSLYGCADHRWYGPVAACDEFRCDLSYVGTYASDRQEKLEELFIKPSRESSKKFYLAGAMYPADLMWGGNVCFSEHVSPQNHPSLYCSSKFTLNITRCAMAHMGYCPSGRLFEAALCGTAILSDYWEGLENFFEPGKEILIVNNSEDVLRFMELPNEKRLQIACSARAKVLSLHTSEKRARELIAILERSRGEL